MNINICNNLQEIVLIDVLIDVKRTDKTESHASLLRSNNTASKKDSVLTMAILVILVMNANILLIPTIIFFISWMKIR